MEAEEEAPESGTPLANEMRVRYYDIILVSNVFRVLCS
jgi:hypothetical protein